MSFKICDKRRCCFPGREPSTVKNREASGEAGAGEGPGPPPGPWQGRKWARRVGLAVKDPACHAEGGVQKGL